jgi:hypothetical protein
MLYQQVATPTINNDGAADLIRMLMKLRNSGINNVEVLAAMENIDEPAAQLKIEQVLKAA